ncbi:MAG: LLM class flavin-dependent oxidoreductase, partial [Candidatus Dormibacteraeota bacterium]|nr:LLM class flavin-dependent oxidoreductase [Candidatus Dormibacteraeota bacterium]
LTGATTLDEMLNLAEQADPDPRWHSIWVGDSILAKPRLDAICTLSALAVRTQRLKMGAACMASTPLRQPLLLAYQWASLDFISGGRTIFVACQGQPGPGGGDFEGEFAALGVEPSTRMTRMEEVVEIMRLLSTQEKSSYSGEHYHFREVTISPNFVSRPLPIWITANPDLRKPRNVESALRRVARLGDGYMTASHNPEGTARCLQDLRRYAAESGRELGPDFAVCLYFNVNINEDLDRAREETVRYLDTYYDRAFTQRVLSTFVAMGSPEHVRSRIQEYIAAGVNYITLRLTSYDQLHQFRRVSEEVLPGLALEEG